MEFSIMCIFTQQGKTFTFKNGAIVYSNETTLQFTYSSMSDGLFKEAIFFKNTICGWSITTNTK